MSALSPSLYFVPRLLGYCTVCVGMHVVLHRGVRESVLAVGSRFGGFIGQRRKVLRLMSNSILLSVVVFLSIAWQLAC